MEHIITHLPQSNQGKVLENFENIELTEDEQVEALRAAREKKHYQLQEQSYWEKVSATPVRPRYTADDLLQMISDKLTVDEHNQEIVYAMCLYFTQDKRFEELREGYKLNKGLYLAGGVGVGKTTLMDFFRKNQLQSFTVISCRVAEQMFANDGETGINYLSHKILTATNSNPFGHTEIGICFDDLGTESEGKYYGKAKNVMTDIILNRYDHQLEYCFTHVTTNLSADEVEERYGTRVRDRMRQMMNLLSFNPDTPSRRK